MLFDHLFIMDERNFHEADMDSVTIYQSTSQILLIAAPQA